MVTPYAVSDGMASELMVTTRYVPPPAAAGRHLRLGWLLRDRFTANSRTQAGNAETAAESISGRREPPRIVFAAGGTGGHVFPAIGIARELQKLHPDAEIQFVGTKNRMEWSEVPKAGYTISAIPAAGLRRPLWSPQNFLLPLKLLVSIIASWRIISEFKPHLVVGTGGYVSGPLCLVAALRGCTVVLQEQNALPGITNKLLGLFATLVFVAFPAAVGSFPRDKCVVSGNPTRLTMDRYISSSVARRLFFPDMQNRVASQDGGPQRAEVVLVLGGSLGAKSINLLMAKMVVEMLEKHPQRYVIWQTGTKYYDETVASVGSHPRLAILGFINSMETAYAAANLVVSRAGAISCSEILASGKPSILIPSPNVTDDHQTKNAESMQQGGAARVLSDDTSPTAFYEAIEELLGDKDVLEEMSQKAIKMAAPNAAESIAKNISKLYIQI